eukprot:362619-Chlamydomonas_euryale.AAC.1
MIKCIHVRGATSAQSGRTARVGGQPAGREESHRSLRQPSPAMPGTRRVLRVGYCACLLLAVPTRSMRVHDQKKRPSMRRLWRLPRVPQGNTPPAGQGENTPRNQPAVARCCRLGQLVVPLRLRDVGGRQTRPEWRV